MYPEPASERVASGAEYLVNPSNDSWFDDPQYSLQAYDIVRLRTVEQRRDMVRQQRGLGRDIQIVGADPAGLPEAPPFVAPPASDRRPAGSGRPGGGRPGGRGRPNGGRSRRQGGRPNGQAPKGRSGQKSGAGQRSGGQKSGQGSGGQKAGQGSGQGGRGQGSGGQHRSRKPVSR